MSVMGSSQGMSSILKDLGELCNSAEGYDTLEVPVKLLLELEKHLNDVTPRVLDLPEAITSDAVAYLEVNGCKPFPMVFAQQHQDDTIDVVIIPFLSIIPLRIDRYGKGWRCWSQRPEDEDMANAGWEES